ncbi:hypothetical protein [Streptomyces sp. NPDC048644]|uniref:hypothetical protein n=1 Tax=Streptomyces sp. NPDC048644 TaxID=3365582 RepID=UPI00371B281E
MTAAGGLVTSGFWCERYVYRSVEADQLASWTATAASDPVFALSHIAADAHEMAAGLPELDRRRLLGKVTVRERVDAIIALHLGLPCGLALRCGAAWVEWSAHPVRFLRMAGPAGAACPLRGGVPEGFGPPLVATDGVERSASVRSGAELDECLEVIDAEQGGGGQ